MGLNTGQVYCYKILKIFKRSKCNKSPLEKLSVDCDLDGHFYGGRTVNQTFLVTIKVPFYGDLSGDQKSMNIIPGERRAALRAGRGLRVGEQRRHRRGAVGRGLRGGAGREGRGDYYGDIYGDQKSTNFTPRPSGSASSRRSRCAPRAPRRRRCRSRNRP